MIGGVSIRVLEIIYPSLCCAPGEVRSCPYVAFANITAPDLFTDKIICSVNIFHDLRHRRRLWYIANDNLDLIFPSTSIQARSAPPYQEPNSKAVLQKSRHKATTNMTGGTSHEDRLWALPLITFLFIIYRGCSMEMKTDKGKHLPICAKHFCN